MPLVIHCRDAEEDCLEILTEVSPNLVILEDINCMVIHRLSKCKEKIENSQINDDSRNMLTMNCVT